MHASRRLAVTAVLLIGAACASLVPRLAYAAGPAAPTPTADAPRTTDGPARVPVAWQKASEAPPIPTTMAKDTYSGHVLLADGLALGTLMLGAQSKSQPVQIIGFVGYLTGGPIVHGLHRRGATAGASVGVRVLTPLVGALTFAGLFSMAEGDKGRSCGNDDCGSGISPAFLGGVVGGFMGFLAAPILDATVLARTEWFDDLALVPAVTIDKGGGSVSISMGGVF